MSMTESAAPWEVRQPVGVKGPRPAVVPPVASAVWATVGRMPDVVLVDRVQPRVLKVIVGRTGRAARRPESPRQRLRARSCRPMLWC